MGGTRTHWLLTALALVLAASLAVLLLTPVKESSPPEEEETVMVTDLNVGTLAAIALVNDSGSVAMMVQNGGIEMIDAPGRMSDSVMKSFLYRMAHMPAGRSLGEVENWEQYGLEDYAAAVVMLNLAGERVRLFLGDAAPLEAEDGEYWYLRREGDDNLYLVDGVTARMMSYSADDFRDLQLFPTLTSERFSQLTRLRIDRPGESMELRGVQQEGAVIFALVEPFEAALSWQLVSSELAAPLGALSAKRVVSEDGDFARYGLTGAEATMLTIESGGERTVLLFAPADEESLYCANAAQETIVIVDRADAAFLNCDVFALMEDSLYARRVADVDGVTIVAENLHATLRVTGQGTMLKGMLADRELNQAETVSLYRALTLLPPAQALGEDGALAGEPVLTLSVSLKDGGEDLIELVPVSERRCAVVINGEASFATYTAAVREIIRAAEQALAAA